MSASLIKWTKGGLKNPMARARGLGSAHDGVHHWVVQRVSAIVLVPLSFWLCWSAIGLINADYTAFTAWLAKPCNAIMMIVFALAAFYHAALGMQVVIEDYVHGTATRYGALIGMKIAIYVTGLACVFAVLKVAL